eukprot:TRINITY_DN2927_c0_g1_i7.p1 TRINITY_DN2927_c0_g1~~TRINITY_DN2927_c0_g1_i7.p1  ORF type:complete len:361 (-),score=29.42 TRINITY_DN2927_c0_g1_i7:104-1186(-)
MCKAVGFCAVLHPRLGANSGARHLSPYLLQRILEYFVPWLASGAALPPFDQWRNEGLKCDGCGAVDFTGMAFCCTVCAKFYLCGMCHSAKREIGQHTPDHKMKMICPKAPPGVRRLYTALAGALSNCSDSKEAKRLLKAPALATEGQVFRLMDGLGRTLFDLAQSFTAMTPKLLEMIRPNPPALLPIHYAVLYDDMDAIKHIAEGGAAINALDGNGLTALHIATLRGNATTRAYLLDHGADSGVVLPSRFPDYQRWVKEFEAAQGPPLASQLAVLSMQHREIIGKRVHRGPGWCWGAPFREVAHRPHDQTTAHRTNKQTNRHAGWRRARRGDESCAARVGQSAVGLWRCQRISLRFRQHV